MVKTETRAQVPVISLSFHWPHQDPTSSVAAKKYQFLTRSESGPKYWIFNTRSPRMNVGFFNRCMPQVRRASFNLDGKLTSRFK